MTWSSSAMSGSSPGRGMLEPPAGGSCHWEVVVGLSSLIESLLGTDLPIGLRAYDGSRLGPPDAATTIVVRSPDALRRIVTAPGELGFARAFVAGDIDVEGDIF